MSPEVLHVGGVLEECLGVLLEQVEVVLFVVVVVERAENLVVVVPLLRHDGGVDEAFDVGSDFVVPGEVIQAVDQLCVCVFERERVCVCLRERVCVCV